MMGLPLAEFDLSDLVRYALFFFVFVAPVLKALVKKKEPEEYQAGGEYELEEPGTDPWEDLMRGVQKERAPEPPVVVATSTPKRVRIKKTEPDHSELLDESVFKRLNTDRSLDESPHLEHHEQVTHFESPELLSTSNASLSAGAFHSLQDRTEAAESVSKARRRASQISAYDWRQAIQHREILAPPLALRRGDSDLPGLR